MDDAGAPLRPWIHRSKGIVGAGILGAVVACSQGNAPQTVTLFVPGYAGPHAVRNPPAACTMGPTSSGFATYLGTGDFEPPVLQPPLSLALTQATPIGLPVATRAIEVQLRGSVWAGVSLVPATGPVNVLALPTPDVGTGAVSACPLPTSAGALGSAAGPSMGLIDASHALVVGGRGAPAYLVDLGTGSVTPVSGNSSFDSRDFATVTPFEGGALVAGGIATTPRADTAVIYQPAADGGPGGFVSQFVSLSDKRLAHGATSLPNGNVLLVGGRDPGGAPLRSIELAIVGQPLSTPVAGLHDARVAPTVLRLPTGKVFVGGGEANGVTVSSVEWFSGSTGDDFSRLLSVDLCGSASPFAACCPFDRPDRKASLAFAPLEGGAVLVVFGGSLPKACVSNVGVIQPDFSVADAHALEPAITPRLFPGARSQPVLFGDRGAVRWNPWTNAFDAYLGGDAEGGSTPVAMASPDPGLALWLGSDSSIWALRFDTRNVYSTDEPTAPPLLVSDPSELAPDRLAETSARPSTVAFNPAEYLTLRAGAGAFLTDATFADVAIDVDATSSPPLSLALLDRDTGSEVDVNLAECLRSFPSGQAVHVERRGGVVAARLGGTGSPGPLTTCSSGSLDANARVAVGFRAGASETEKASASHLVVQRLGSSK